MCKLTSVVVVEEKKQKGYVGSDVKKLDNAALLTGHAHFSDDIRLPGMLYLAILRSNFAHAKIIHIDTGKISGMQGVLRVLTGEELSCVLHPFPRYPKFSGLKYSRCYPLAVDKVMFQGEPVAAVVAESPYRAYDALEEIDVEYAPLKPVLNIEQSKSEDIRLYDDWDNNMMLEFKIATESVDEVFESGDRLVEGKVHIQRQCAAPLECRGYIASYEPISDELLVYASTQRPHVMRNILSEVLSIKESKIRVIQSTVGGGFGQKTTPHREEALVCAVSKMIGRPVKWIETRRENLLSGHAREQIHSFKASVKSDGRILAIKDEMYADLGSYFPQPGVLQTLATCDMITGPYAIEEVQIKCYGMATNKAPFYPYRGFGEESATIVHERLMDLVAKQLGLDKVEVRKRNLIKPGMFPYTTPTGLVYDSGDYFTLLETALAKVGYSELLSAKAMSAPKRYVGLGLSIFVKGSAPAAPDSFLQSYEVATVRVDPSGNVTVITGLSSIGQGTETGIAQVVADELGVYLEDVNVVQGDTLASAFGLGMYGSRGLVLGGSAALMAARLVKEKALKVASYLLKTEPTDLEIKSGVVHSKGTGSSVRLSEIANKLLKDVFRLPKDIEPGLEATYYFRAPNVSNVPDEHGHMNTCATYSSGANAVIVEVLPDTGEVKVLRLVGVIDCGRVINPGLARGQVIGGLVQGLGSALYEEVVYDETGNQLNSTFMDYCLPTALVTPNIDVSFYETLSPYTPLGAKGVGEMGIQAIQAAVMSAVNDAISANGDDITEFPIKQELVWRKLRNSTNM